MSASVLMPKSGETFGAWLQLPNRKDDVHVYAQGGLGIVIGRNENATATSADAFSDGALCFSAKGGASFQYADVNKRPQSVALPEAVVFAEISQLLTRLHAAAIAEARQLLDAETVTPLDPTP